MFSGQARQTKNAHASRVPLFVANQLVNELAKLNMLANVAS